MVARRSQSAHPSGHQQCARRFIRRARALRLQPLPAFARAPRPVPLLTERPLPVLDAPVIGLPATVDGDASVNLQHERIDAHCLTLKNTPKPLYEGIAVWLSTKGIRHPFVSDTAFRPSR